MIKKVLFTFLALACLAPFLRSENYSFGSGSTIVIDLPEGWTSKSKRGKENSLLISLKSESDKRMKCDVSVMRAPPPADARLLDPQKLKTTVDLLAKFKGVKSSSKPIETKEGIGYIAYDSNGFGICMITPSKGISITIHFSKAKDLDMLQSIFSSIRTIRPNS